MDMRTLHPGSKAQDKGDSRNNGLQDPYVYTILYHTILYHTILYNIIYDMGILMFMWSCRLLD